MTRRLLILLLALVGGAPPAAARPDAGALAAEAAAAFEAGVRSAGDGATGAAETRFVRAAELYAQVVQVSGPNPKLYYNEGTSWLRAGDVGRAILAFRRAERAGGAADPRLQRNLGQALDRVRTRIDVPPSGVSGAADLAALAPGGVVLWVGLSCFTAAWAIAGARLLRAGWASYPLAGAGLAGAAACLGVLLLADQARPAPNRGVVLAAEVTGRLGPDADLYQSSFGAPLTSGVEFSVVADRPGWSLVRLDDGRETWLPHDAFALVGLGE